MLLTDEAERRDLKQLGRRLTKSGLAPDKTRAPTQRELATCRFVQRSARATQLRRSGTRLDLYEVICNRYERHATAITSNRDFNEWPLVFANPLMVSATHGPAGASRREDRHRGQELSHGQLRAPLTGTAAALGGPAMRPYRPGARGCPDTTSPSGGALRAVLARCLFGRRTEMHPESRRSGIPVLRHHRPMPVGSPPRA